MTYKPRSLETNIPILANSPTDASVAALLKRNALDGQMVFSRFDATLWVRDNGSWMRVSSSVVVPPTSPYQDYYATDTNAFVSTDTDVARIFNGFNARTDCVQYNWSLARWQQFWDVCSRAETATAATSAGVTIKQWDVARIAAPWNIIEPTTHGVFALANLQSQVDRAITAGFKVILDPVHIKAGGSYAASFPSWMTLGTATDTVRDLTADTSSDGNYILALWVKLCELYADVREVIAFDLLNEPGYGGTAATGHFVRNGACMAMFRDLIDKLRPNGWNQTGDITKGKILIVTPCTGASALASDVVGLASNTGSYTTDRINISADWPDDGTRDNIVMTWHDYYGGGGTGAGGGTGTNNGFSTSGYMGGAGTYSTNYANGVTNVATAKTHKTTSLALIKSWADALDLPIFIGEYGAKENSTNDLQWCTDTNELYDSYGWSRTWWDVSSGDNHTDLNLRYYNDTNEATAWDYDRLCRILAA